MRRPSVRWIALPFFLACVFLLTGRSPATAQTPAAAPDERPNILVILADDLGYRDVGFQGAIEIETPHLDRIAAAGVVFSNGYVAHPLCNLSRGALMTGRYPTWFDSPLPLEERTFARYLKEAGYRTGIVGKWHLGTEPMFHPLNRGFDYFYGFTGGGHDYFRIDLTAAPLQEYLLPLNDGRGASGFSGYLTDALTDRAIEFADRGGGPFFLYLSYNAPHAPLQAPAETVAKYRHVEDASRRTYLAMIDALDANVGRLVEALRTAGRWDNTLTFFLSDNGGDHVIAAADNRPLRAGKGTLLEGGVRVPFAASWPARWPGGATFEPPVISLDIAATALAAAGARAAAHLSLDGVNLDPYVRGAAAGVPHQALFWKAGRNRAPHMAVRAGDAKLVGPIGGPAALFDLGADPGETRDLSAENADLAARLTALWGDWEQRTADDFFWTSWHERESVGYLLRAMYRTTVAGEPAARANFDVYLDRGRITYVKEPCTARDTQQRFFLHLFPGYSDAGKRHGFENLSFYFRDHGVILDGRCLAVVTFPLREYELASVRTGQFLHTSEGYPQMWQVDFEVGGGLAAP